MHGGRQGGLRAERAISASPSIDVDGLGLKLEE